MRLRALVNIPSEGFGLPAGGLRVERGIEFEAAADVAPGLVASGFAEAA